MSEQTGPPAAPRFKTRALKQTLACGYPQQFMTLNNHKFGKLDERQVLRQLLETVCQAGQARLGILMVLEENRRQMVFYDAYGLTLSGPPLQALAWSLKRLAAIFPRGWGQVFFVRARELAQRAEFAFERRLGFKSLYYQPLGRDQQLLGAVLMGNRRGQTDFTAADLQKTAEAARAASVELERVWLYRELHNMLMNTIRGFVSTLEAKDRYTHGHSERVARYAVAMANLLEWPQTMVDQLRMSAMLHDIGKIGVPESILLKPGPLTQEEYQVIQGHPENGVKIVETIPQLEPALCGVLFHHERYDGQGYPFRLAGTDIPAFGRIIGVADAFDAMTGERPYRPGLSRETALAELEVNRGKQFDTEMVEAFIQVQRRGIIVP